MGELMLRPAGRAELATLPSLLEFQSPSAALAQAPVRGPARVTIFAVCTMVAALTAAASLIPVDKVVTAQGRVVAKNPTVVVQPLETAIVRSIDVKEGQLVKQGDILARLDPTFAAADVGALQQQVASLQAEADRLAAEATNQLYRPASGDKDALLQTVLYNQRRAEREFKLENFSQKIGGLQSSVERAISDISGYRQRLSVASNVESMRRELQAGGVGSKLNTLSAIDTRLELQRNEESAQRQLQSARSELDAMRAERDGYEQTWRGQVSRDLTDTSRKLSDAREQLNKATLRRQLVELRAPQDAVVLTVARVSVGSVLQSGDQFLTLVPTDAPLEVEVNVAGSDAGFVATGEPVTVKFDTLPYVRYGSAQGTVRLISADSFTQDPDTQQRGAQRQPNPGQQAQSFYRARVTLDEMQLHDVPPGFRVMPGMPVTADVKVGERTVMSYMLSRALPVWLDGMREP